MVRTGPGSTPSTAPKPTTAGISPRRRYLRFMQVWIESRAASRRRIRSTLRGLDPASRRRMMQSAVFNIVRSLNEEAGATPSSSGATTNRMLRGDYAECGTMRSRLRGFPPSSCQDKGYVS